MAQAREADGRIVQPAGHQQGAGIQQHQVSGALQQLRGQAAAPVEHGLQVFAAEQPGRAEAGHVADRHVDVAGGQRQFDGLVGEVQGVEDAAGGQAQAVDVGRGLASLQHLGDHGQQAVPAAVAVGGQEE
ncbi:hypothetical protein D9M73_181820 [compost metagenome]